jgi:hypothetical protein
LVKLHGKQLRNHGCKGFLASIREITIYDVGGWYFNFRNLWPVCCMLKEWLFIGWWTSFEARGNKWTSE